MNSCTGFGVYIYIVSVMNGSFELPESEIQLQLTSNERPFVISKSLEVPPIPASDGVSSLTHGLSIDLHV